LLYWDSICRNCDISIIYYRTIVNFLLFSLNPCRYHQVMLLNSQGFFFPFLTLGLRHFELA